MHSTIRGGGGGHYFRCQCVSLIRGYVKLGSKVAGADANHAELHSMTMLWYFGRQIPEPNIHQDAASSHPPAHASGEGMGNPYHFLRLGKCGTRFTAQDLYYQILPLYVHIAENLASVQC